MSYPPCERPLPSARLDPVDSFSEALWLMLSTIDTEPIAETVLFVLDDTRCGVGVTHVESRGPDDVVAAVDWIASTAGSTVEAAGLIVGSVRPNGGAELGDLARWAQIAELCDEAGLELLEWIVLGSSGVTCPREVSGAPPRWRC
jgi:hypothetical protein